ncbi:helix-turn-helix domain-containing protein [Paenibacillus alkalitolerans]|uniref:helix-turn-helix domain-containing protein n=1 Tax=Paenibacillus alkalitolerans TaxID=2799335 RepID=UPI001F286D70|nr:helix-turn-helix domain-containing protein [Paenibacillus alkalitolerans]
MISTGKAAELLGLRPRTIQAWLKSGKLKGIKLGSVWRIQVEEVNRLLSAGGSPSPKLNRIPEPLLRLKLEDGRAVSFVESTDGFILVAVDGKPRATIQPEELPALIRSLIQNSGSNRATAELATGV